MATKFQLLKLSKKELIKKCRKKKIKLPKKISKSKLIDSLLLKDTNEQKLKRTRSKSKSKLLQMNTIPFDNPPTSIKGVCQRLNNNVLLEQTRIRGACRICKNIVVYRSKSHQFIQTYTIKFTQKYSIDRVWILGIDLNKFKLFALWCQNAANYTFNKLIEYNLSESKWTQKDDFSIKLAVQSHFPPHIIVTANKEYHIFKFRSNSRLKRKYTHWIWDQKSNKTQKCRTFGFYSQNIFYDSRLNTIFMVHFEHLSSVSGNRVSVIHIHFLKLNMDRYKWDKAVIDMRDKENAQFDSVIDQWCIANGTRFIVFYCDDQSIKSVDFMAMSDVWSVCEYELPQNFISAPTSKFDVRNVFVTDDGIIHFFRNNQSKDKIYHFKDKDGLSSQHHRIALEHIDCRLYADQDLWISVIYGFVFDKHSFVPIPEIAQLIRNYCFLS